MADRHAHCGYCGARFPPRLAWPRSCWRCRRLSYANPLPVVVLLVPVDEGLLFVRRGEEPGRGLWALPGGFIDHGESWRTAAVRELFEEANVQADPNQVEIFGAESIDGLLLMFGRVPPRSSAELPPFAPTPEVMDRIVARAPGPMAFPLHAVMVERFFALRSSP